MPDGNKNNFKNNFKTIIQNLKTSPWLDQNLLGLQKSVYLEYFRSYFLVVAVLMSTFKNKNSLRTIEAQIVQKIKNNAARLKATGSYKKKACTG